MARPERLYAFGLAERLGMTLSELGERMDSAEFAEWAARDKIVDEELKRLAKGP